MNADDVFRYGHLTVMGAVDGLPATEWEIAGVCGVWSVKEIIAHLASFELAIAEVFASLLDEGPTPLLDEFRSQDGDLFNAKQVALRGGWSAEDVLAEYTRAFERAAALLEQLPLERRRQTGALPWYGTEYDLEDLIGYMSYGHKREHCAQIAVFRDRLQETAAA